MEQSDYTNKMPAQMKKMGSSLTYEDIVNSEVSGQRFWVCNKHLENRIITVNALTGSGVTYPLQVDPLSTVDTIKDQIAKVTHIPPDFQFLFRNETELEKDKALYCYEIIDGSMLHVVARREIDVLVAMAGGGTQRLKMWNTELVRAASSSHSVWLEDLRLDPERALCIYTGDEETVELEAGEGWMQLWVLSLSGVDELPVRATRLDSVNNVKRRLSEKLGASWETANYLSYKGDLLEEARLLTECGIEDGSKLRLHGKDSIRVVVTSLANMIHILMCNRTQTILSVKLQILNAWGVTVDMQILIFHKTELQNQHTLAYYNVKSDDVIYVLLRYRGGGPPPLYVMDRMGHSVKVEVYPYDTVENVKTRIEQRVGIPPEEQELVIYDERIMGKREIPRIRRGTTCSLS